MWRSLQMGASLFGGSYDVKLPEGKSSIRMFAKSIEHESPFNIIKPTLIIQSHTNS